MPKPKRYWFNKEMLTLTKIAERTGISRDILKKRLYTNGGSIEKATRKKEEKKTGLMGNLTEFQRKEIEEFRRIGDREEEILKRIEKY